MLTNYVEPKIEAGADEVQPPAVEIESAPLAPIQTGLPGEDGSGTVDAPQARNSKLVGFERGSVREEKATLTRPLKANRMYWSKP